MMQNNATHLDVQIAIAGLIGKSCCRQRVGRGRSLSLGFGDKVFHGKTRLIDPFYGEWEVGSYCAEWHIVQGETSLCSSHDFVDKPLMELDKKLSKILLGKIEALEFLDKLHIRIRLSAGIQIDFLAKYGEDDDDEFFHVFCPNGNFVACSLNEGWLVGKSDQPL